MDNLGPIRNVFRRHNQKMEEGRDGISFAFVCVRVWLLAMALGFSQAGDL